jgi:hypothetical protein
LYVNRVVKANAVKADGDILDSAATDVWGTFTAKSKGTYGNDLRIRITVNAADLYDVEVLQEAGVDADASDDTILESYYNLDLSVFGAQEIVDVFAIRSQFVDFAWGPSGTGLTVATSFSVLPLTSGTDGTGDDDYTTALAALEQVDPHPRAVLPGSRRHRRGHRPRGVGRGPQGLRRPRHGGVHHARQRRHLRQRRGRHDLRRGLLPVGVGPGRDVALA